MHRYKLADTRSRHHAAADSQRSQGGTGRAKLWRHAPPNPVPVDIHFRVIQTATSNVMLHSDCYELVVRD